MRIGRLVGVAAVCLVAVLVSGCMTAPSGVAASTKPLAQDGYTSIGPTEGRAVGVYLLGLIPLSEPYPARAAVDRAIRQGGGDALVDVTVDYMTIMIPPFVNVMITTANGTAVKSN